MDRVLLFGDKVIGGLIAAEMKHENVEIVLANYPAPSSQRFGRLMTQVSPDRTQTLEVLGTRNLLEVLRTQLEAEGVGVTTTKSDPPKPVIIEPVQERIAYDIGIPLTKPRLVHDIRKLSDLVVAKLEPIFEQEDLAEIYRIKLKQEFAVTKTEVGQVDVGADDVPAHELLARITNKTIDRAKLPNRFSDL